MTEGGSAREFRWGLLDFGSGEVLWWSVVRFDGTNLQRA